MNSSKKTFLIVGVILLLIASNLFFFLKNYDRDNDSINNKVEKRSEEANLIANSDLMNLESQFNASLAKLDQLQTDNARIKKLLANKEQEILMLKQQIAHILNDKNATREELVHAQQMVDDLQIKVSDYEKQIALLTAEKNALSKKNSEAAKRNRALQKKNEELSKDLDLAKQLVASNIRMNAIDLRKDGRVEKRASNVKNVDLLRILFDIDRNSLAESGNYIFQVLITDPSGKLLKNSALGSGRFKDENGQLKDFSVERAVALTSNTARLSDIAVDWQQTDDYLKGSYAIGIYCQGYMIGNSSVTLK